jgi:dipeptidase
MRNIYQWQDSFPRVVSSNFKTPDYEPRPGQIESIPLGSIPQPEVTWAYWDFDYGMQNEWGLSIGESTGNAKTAGWAKSQPYGYNLLGIEDLSKLALERCKTARCAVELLGGLAVEHGFYSADSGDPSNPGYDDSAEILVLADTEDVWIWNVMTGKNNASAIWAAVRIPPDHVAVIADSFSFSLDLNDPANNLYSQGVADLAEEMGWRKWDKELPGHFDFFLAYGAELDEPAKTNMGYYISRRIWRGYTLLTPEAGAALDSATSHLANGGRLPTSLPARPGSVTIDMCMNVLRDHFEGTPFDLTKGMAAGPFGNPNRQDTNPPGRWERAFSLTRTIVSSVLTPRPNGRSISWFSYDTPHGSVYLPLYAAATDSAPSAFHSQSGSMSVFSRDVAWWAFNLVNTWSNLNFRLINADILARAHAKEAEAQMLIKAWEAEADMSLGPQVDVNQDAALAQRRALDVLTARSNAFLEDTVNDWWRLLEQLFAKYSRFSVTYSERDEGAQEYPEWWLNSLEVGFRTWSPAGPNYGAFCSVDQPCCSVNKNPHPRSEVTELTAMTHVPAVVAPPLETFSEIAVETPTGVVALSPGVLVAALGGVALSVGMSAWTYRLGVRHGSAEAIGSQIAGSYASFTA